MKWLAITTEDPKPNRLVLFRTTKKDGGEFMFKGSPTFSLKLDPIPCEIGYLVSRYSNLEGNFFILRGVQKENFNNLIEFKVESWNFDKKHTFCYLDEENSDDKKEVKND